MIAWIALLVSLLIVLVAAAVGMRRGWRNRARRQAALLPAFPEAPADAARAEPLLPPMHGVYVSTASAADWQDRIAVGDIGFRAAATLRLSALGLLVERTGASPLWIAAGAIRGARTASALAGKVMGNDGLLVVRWRLAADADGGAEHELDTGFRGDDRNSYPDWVATIRGLAGSDPRCSDRHDDRDGVKGGGSR
ncbi:MAG: transporter [Sciscionella sp.]